MQKYKHRILRVEASALKVYVRPCVYRVVQGAAARWHSARQWEYDLLGAHCRVDHRDIMSAAARDRGLRLGSYCGSLVRR